MVLCVTLNPCVDRTLFVEKLELDRITAAHASKCIPGGKGNNVARVLKTFGVPVDSFILVGGHTGRMVEDMIRFQDAITPICFWTRAATREVITVKEDRTNRQVAFKEPGALVTAVERKQLLLVLKVLMPQYQWVIFSGSVPCPALNDIYFEAITMAQNAGAKTVLDSSGEALSAGLLAAPYLVKFNLDEASHALRQPLTDDDGIWRGISCIQQVGAGRSGEACVPRIVAVTAGRQGVYLSARGERWRATPPPIQTVNPVGSGDSFLGAMVAGLAQGESIENSLCMGVAAGAANAAVWDAATFSRADVERLIPQVTIRKL